MQMYQYIWTSFGGIARQVLIEYCSYSTYDDDDVEFQFWLLGNVQHIYRIGQ